MSGFDGWWRLPSCGGPSRSYADILKHAIWIGNGQDMWVTRVLRKTQIKCLSVGIPIHEVSCLIPCALLMNLIMTMGWRGEALVIHKPAPKKSAIE